MDQPQGEEDPLSQRTRARLFAVLAELKRPAGTEELARRLGLHPNGIRAHLKRMREAGLVVSTPVRRRAGRPPHEWSLAPDAEPGGRAPHAYRDLAQWLAEAIPAQPHRLREVEDTGRKIGRQLVPPGRGPARERLQTLLAALGFRPTVEQESAEGFVCRLCNCPYRDSAIANREVVCGLHRGITEGLIEAIEPRAELTRFEPGDPEAARCLVEIRGLTAGDAARPPATDSASTDLEPISVGPPPAPPST